MGIALALSALLNLFLAGALVGGLIGVRAHGRMIPAGSLRVAGAELPVAERRAFRSALRDARRSAAPAAAAARSARMEAAALLRGPAPDPARINAALDRARAGDVAVRTGVERRAVAFAAGLPAADRARLADAMDARARRGGS